MQHRYTLIGGPLAGHNVQYPMTNHNPDGFLMFSHPGDVHAFMMSDADPVKSNIRQLNYVIVATEAHTGGPDDSDGLAIYYAVPAEWSIADAMTEVCAYAVKQQNALAKLHQMYGSSVAEVMQSQGLKPV